MEAYSSIFMHILQLSAMRFALDILWLLFLFCFYVSSDGFVNMVDLHKLQDDILYPEGCDWQIRFFSVLISVIKKKN